MKTTMTLAACALLTVAGVASAEGDPARGAQSWAVCQGCHGANGEGMQARGAPRLAGQYGWYLARQLRNFRAGIRGRHPEDELGALMAGMAAILPDDQAVEDVVAYIQTLK